jgi:UDP-GlcNAc:undecaprenyl-phosphate GlcNAc-1-phosphate transferase
MIMGIIDDINSVPARYQFLTHLVVASIVVFYGKIYLSDVSFFGINLSFPPVLSYAISIIFIVSLISAINLVDGLDGMSSGIGIIYFTTICIVAYLLNRFTGLEIILALIMIGALFGHLVYNFPPASTFMGQCGSNFLGFMVAVTSLIGFKTTTFISVIIPLVILALPIFDTALSILRRFLKGQGITEPDKEHFHHQLLKMRFSPRLSVLIVYMINILFAAVSIFYILGDDLSAVVIYILLMILLLFIVLKTDILFEHRKNKKEIEEPAIDNKKEEVKQVSKPKKKTVNKTKRKK